METRKTKTLTLSAEEGQLVIYYFISAYSDYLGARTLLSKGLLSQGVILANTSIEKYFKGILTSVNVPVSKRHDISIKKYDNTIKNRFRRLHNTINWEFVKFISMTYEMRYLDDLKPGYGIAIARLKTLAELDSLVCEIEKSFQIGASDKPNRYKSDVDKLNPILYDLNHHLLKQDKTLYIEQLDQVHQFGIMSPKLPVQIEYIAEDIKNDGKFLYEAMSSSVSDLIYRPRMCFTPFEF